MLAALLFSLTHKVEPDTIRLTVDHDDRVAYAIAPAKPAADPPVVFMFHGHGGSAENCRRRFSLEERWPEAVIVYCDGLPIKTAGGDGKGWQVEIDSKNRDVRFFDALLPQVLKKYHADPKHVFAWGFSNGGMFIYTLWTMRADKFAGFCTSGSCFTSDAIKLSAPKPAFVTVCGNDEVVPTSYQQQAFEEVEKADKSEEKGEPFGEAGTYFKGAEPVVEWRYNGGHEFPFESFPKLIEFFRTLAKS